MKYIALKHKTINLTGKGQFEIDAGEDSIILVPEEGSKIYLHWKTDTGKLTTTYTMTFPTKVEGKVTVINALDKPTAVRAIW
jgi:hypothetical protein